MESPCNTTECNVSLEAVNQTSTSDVPDSVLRSLIVNLNKYLIPVIISVGLVGNSLSLVVFVATYLNRLSLSVYLAALAVSDSFFLLTMLVIWLNYVKFPLFHREGFCQGTVYVSYCSSFLSVWLVVSFTVERYIAICHPLKRPEMCTVGRARMVVAGLVITAMVGYSCTLWTTGIAVVRTHYRLCTPLEDYMRVHTLLTYIDTILTLIIPFVLILVLNITITHRIAYFHHQRKITQRASSTGILQVQQDTLQMLTSTDPRLESSETEQSQMRVTGSTPSDSLCPRAQVKVTKMLLLVSSLFLLTSLPSYVMRMRFFLLTLLHKDLGVTYREMLVQQLFQLVYYTNFAINFFLYSLCSAKFREAFNRFWWQLRYKSRRLRENIYQAIRKAPSSSSSHQAVPDLHQDLKVLAKPRRDYMYD